MSRHVKMLAFLCMLVLVCPILVAETPSMVIQSPLFGIAGDDTIVPMVPRVSELSLVMQLGIDTPLADSVVSKDERLLLAVSDPRYPVTPGDVLQLTYVDGKVPVSLSLQVDSAYRASIPSVGSVEGRGKAFTAFAKEIEALVQKYYPFSTPRVVLAGTGAFSVAVKGEVHSVREVGAWGMSRLSSTAVHATPYASSRRVRITALDGTVKEYDLYRALRNGDLSQDPLLKPGDTVEFLPAQRIVVLAGQVLRPGVYQLLSGETLLDVLDSYGGGLLPGADASQIIVQKHTGVTGTPLEVLRIAYAASKEHEPMHMDEVLVLRPANSAGAVVVEGAVVQDTMQQVSGLLTGSGRLLYRFYPGESVSDLVLALSGLFSPASDLRSAYLQRVDGTVVAVDAQAMLAGTRVAEASTALIEGDRLVIPFSQLFVTVSGGVVKPGNYPYIPDKKASYYIAMAGGFDPSRNRNGDYSVTDGAGNKVAKDSVVYPESIVTASMNTFNAINGQTIANSVAVVGLVSSVVMVVYYLIQISNNL